MRVIFAGTPEFAKVALAALKEAGFEIVLVLTQPDRPAGRGLKLQASPVKQFALDQGMDVAQPRSLRLDGKFADDATAAKARIEAARADVMVVAAYGLILPQWVLDAPRFGCLNIHASLLPRWRGAAPIHRAIEAGDAETGITIMQMDAGLDTGDMLLTQAIAIELQDTTPSLHDKLALIGGQLIVQTLSSGAWQLARVPQPAQGITYAHKIDKAESPVDWNLTASAIARKIRAFAPAPGCSSQLRGETLKICSAMPLADTNYEINSKLLNTDGWKGTIFNVNDEGIDVMCAPESHAPHGSLLRITELQRAGARRLPVAQFLRGFPMQIGERFESIALE